MARWRSEKCTEKRCAQFGQHSAPCAERSSEAMGISAPASHLVFDHLDPAQWSSAFQFYKAHYLEGARLKPGN